MSHYQFILASSNLVPHPHDLYIILGAFRDARDGAERIKCSKGTSMPSSLHNPLSTIMRSTAALRLKLFALPLSRQVGSAPPHFYLHAQSISPSSLTAPDGSPLPVPLVTKALNTAASQWSKLGQSKDGSLKKKAYVGPLEQRVASRRR